MRLGKVVMKFEYVVDLDNERMVDHAKEYIIEDIENMLKYENPYGSIDIEHDTEGKLSESDITTSLIEDEAEDEDYAAGDATS